LAPKLCFAGSIRSDIEQWDRYVGERRIDVVDFIAICHAIPADSAAILAKVAKLV
jgi:hypothetical protein